MITEFDIDGAYASYCDKSGFVRLDGRFEADDLRYILAAMDSPQKDAQKPRPNAIPLNDQSWIVPGPKSYNGVPITNVGVLTQASDIEPYGPTQSQIDLACHLMHDVPCDSELGKAARDVLLRALTTTP